MNWKKMTTKELRQIVREYNDNPNPKQEYIKIGTERDYKNGMGQDPIIRDIGGWSPKWTDEQEQRWKHRTLASGELECRIAARTARRRRQARKIDKHNRGRDLRRGLSKKTQKFAMKNTTLWPTVLVNLVTDFVLKEIERKGGRSKLYDLTMQHTNRGGHGHAYRCGKVHVAHNRERPRMNWKYATISWAKDNATKTGLQSLCHIIAHELIHTTRLAPAKIKNGKRQVQAMEFKTDNLAAEIVSAFAKVEFSIWSKYRKHRRTQRNTDLRKKRASAQRKTSGAKMGQAEMNLARWQDELEKAKRNVKKWETKVNRMRGARKAAATRAANKCK